MIPHQLMIVRHAKSSWGDQSVPDNQRPLNNRGSKEALILAGLLKEKKYFPDLVLSSTALRAKQTVDAIVKYLEIPHDRIKYIPQLYLAEPETHLQLIRTANDNCTSLMLVGHNPGLENLIKHLCCDPLPFTTDGKLLTTANFVLLEFQFNWSNVSDHSGKLIDFIRPKELN